MLLGLRVLGVGATVAACLARGRWRAPAAGRQAGIDRRGLAPPPITKLPREKKCLISLPLQRQLDEILLLKDKTLIML